MVTGMGSHQSAVMQKDEWLTPPDIIESLGSFDLDPCSPIERPWDTAKNHMTILNDGLRTGTWSGRVWLNPPYGTQTGRWLARLSKHGNGIALIFARTETKMFFDHVWAKADGILFIKGRLHFYHANGKRATHNSGAPSCLVAYGNNNADVLKHCGIDGQFVDLRAT